MCGLTIEQGLRKVRNCARPGAAKVDKNGTCERDTWNPCTVSLSVISPCGRLKSFLIWLSERSLLVS